MIAECYWLLAIYCAASSRVVGRIEKDRAASILLKLNIDNEKGFTSSGESLLKAYSDYRNASGADERT